MNPRAPYLLFRIDDRLLHGQVSLGWGTRLAPRAYLIADDETAGDPLARSMYEAAHAGGARVVCATIDAVLEGDEGLPPPERTVLLVRSVDMAARLLRGGIPGPVNVGGLHLKPGARERLGFLFLTESDERILAALLAERFELYAQDLPTNRSRPVTLESLRGAQS